MPYSDRNLAIERLRSFPVELEALVRPLSDDVLDGSAPGEWTTRQIVHHLADSHMSAVFRFKKPLTEANPAAIPVYDQEAWAELPDYQLPLEPSFQILRGLHARFVALLESLSEDQWHMTGLHPEWGAVTVANVAERYAAHCDNHINQINRNLAHLANG
jgi:hypothetical protein